MEEELKFQENINPWFSIWTKPRKTIRYILDNNMTNMVILLAALGGISQVLSSASQKNLGDKLELEAVILFSVVLGALMGIIALYVNSALLRLTGKWIGGEGTFKDIKIASAWAKIPVAWGLLVWVPELLLFKNEMFTSSTPLLENNIGLSLVMILFGLIELTIAIWAIVIYIKSIAEVQGFSAWKAIINILLAGLIIIIPLAIIAVIGLSLLSGMIA